MTALLAVGPLAALLSKAGLAAPQERPEVPVPFGFKTAWLAVRGVPTEHVVNAIHLVGARPSGWPEGIKAMYQGQCFVSPPIKGWVLAACPRLPDMGDERHPNEARPFLRQLSRDLDTDVQYFGSHRVVEYQAWAWASHGKVTRMFGYLGDAGDTLANEGEPTEIERSLGLTLTIAPYTNDKLTDAEIEKAVYPGEADVMAVAGTWSVNPQDLGRDGVPMGPGVLGELPALQ